MKIFQQLAGITLVSSIASAFPANAPEIRQNVPGFNAKQQYVSTHGKHRWIAADFAKGDQRGPCPGLNALANHGYIPRSGYGPIVEMAQGTFVGAGLGEDIAQFFSFYGAFAAGDGLHWSIGGPPPSGVLSKTFPGFFGKPLGISFSHNEYEADGSALRDDLYENGNDYKLNMPAFKVLYDALETPATSLAQLSAQRNYRIQHNIHHNPDFFQGPFTGIGVVGAATAFVYRLFGNKSAEYPQGLLNQDILKSFCGVTGEGDNLKWNPGTERIPDNWFKRSDADQYDFPLAGADLAEYAAEHPDTAKVGGNTHGVNTFTGVDVGNFTGGVFSAENLLQGNNLACFAYQSAALLAPDFLAKKFREADKVAGILTQTLSKALVKLNCPELKSLDKKQLEQFPGYRKSQKGENGYHGNP